MAPTLTEQLGTITAIVALALGVVQVLKMLLMKYKVGIVNSLPTPMICVVVSIGLTLLANLVIKTLPGAWYDLLWQAALAAGAASGLFTWLSEPLDSPEAKSKAIPFLVASLGLSLVLSAGGCTGMSSGQKYILTCQTVEATANTLISLDKAGAFGVADRAHIKAAGKLAKVLLLKMRDELIAGDTSFGFDYTLTQLQAVLDEMLRMQLQAEAAQTTKETSSGPIDAGNYRIDGGAEHGLAAGEDYLGMPSDGQRPDPSGDRHGDGGGGGRPGRPGRAVWRTPCPVPLLSLVPEVEWD